MEGHLAGRARRKLHAVSRRVNVAIAVALLASAIPLSAPAQAGKRASGKCGHEGCEAVAGSTDRRGGGTRQSGKRRRVTTPVTCRNVPLEVPPDTVFYRSDGTPIPTDGTGRWYNRVCSNRDRRDAILDRYPEMGDVERTQALGELVRNTSRRPIYIRPRAIELVDEARDLLVFPTAEPRFAPADPWTYVNHPTALWIDPASWQPQTAVAEAPGVRVVVTATPKEVRWSLGDSHELVCPGPGRPPDPAQPDDDGDCSHTWRWPSAGYDVTATIHWHVTWTAEGAPGGGDLGVFPTRSPATAVPVAEIQALNVPPRS